MNILLLKTLQNCWSQKNGNWVHSLKYLRLLATRKRPFWPCCHQLVVSSNNSEPGNNLRELILCWKARRFVASSHDWTDPITKEALIQKRTVQRQIFYRVICNLIQKQSSCLRKATTSPNKQSTDVSTAVWPKELHSVHNNKRTTNTCTYTNSFMR